MSGTFGENMRGSRLAGRDPTSQRPLSMERLGEMIGERLGTPNFPSYQIIWNWEHNKNQPDARDRNLILAIVDALVAASGLRTAGEANGLLDSGGYTLLRPEEQARLFPDSNRDKHIEPPTLPAQQFYVERSSDRLARAAIHKTGVTMTINGPHAFGKSLLLDQVEAEAIEIGKRTVRFDVQEMAIDDATTFFRHFCSGMARQVGVAERLETFYNPAVSYQEACRAYVEGYLFNTIDTSIVLIMDTADRLVHAQFRNSFFAMLRAWHNRRSRQPVWSRLDLILAISMDPSELVIDAHQSPFNVADPIIALPEFSEEEVRQLNTVYHAPLHATEITELMGLVGGHPKLLSDAFSQLTTSGCRLEELLAHALLDGPDNPFASHLEHQLRLLRRDPALGKAMQQVLRSQRCSENAAYIQLNKAGLIYRKGQQVLPRCRLYAHYFGEHLR